ncbi:class I histocompatibility antigen, F10 alpha chain-like [Chanos chanos]|uniref:Class I histocompatibility antigen, F10 alpha chain-like n=1 Tax=Chanos chanos TaxID=29144 RepID=A0A6J2WP88_CHACN|nr:class I histocompatibility antigen, F10 alpha chain-like [Chanos chanos]
MDGSPAASPLRWAAAALQGSLNVGHSVSLALEGRRKEEAPRTSLKLQKKHRGGCGSRGVIRGVAYYFYTSRGLITPGWVAQVRVSDDLRPKTSYDPGFITDDVSKSRHLVFQETLMVTKMHNAHSFNCYFVGTQGLHLPEYFEVFAVDDVTVFYYDSNMKEAVPVPEWMNSTAAQQLWKELNVGAEDNMNIMETAMKSATQQFNLTGISPVKIYQAHGGCDLHPDGTVQGSLTHAFNGKDFLSFDMDSETFIASVPQAFIYKRLRERDPANLEIISSFYKRRCTRIMEIFLQHVPELGSKKVPEVSLFEKQSSAFTEITCHVTGFYPRTVQVQWFGSDMQPVVEGVIEGEVLPNGDGSYQIRKSVVIPAEHTDIHHYSCVVQHSSIPGNITKTWVGKQDSSVMFAVVIPVVVGVLVMIGFGLMFWWYRKRETGML